MQSPIIIIHSNIYPVVFAPDYDGFPLAELANPLANHRRRVHLLGSEVCWLAMFRQMYCAKRRGIAFKNASNYAGGAASTPRWRSCPFKLVHTKLRRMGYWMANGKWEVEVGLVGYLAYLPGA